MNKLPTGLLEPSRVCTSPCPIAAIETTPFKGDEGYSEDTRSQDGDSSLGIDVRTSGMGGSGSTLLGLSDVALSLDEADRSGKNSRKRNSG